MQVCRFCWLLCFWYIECQGDSSNRKKRIGYATAPNDVWALGVILVNLAAGRNPWRQASLSDETFYAYLSDPNFLLKILPISRELNQILKRIFCIDPLRRISLNELRERIKRCKYFTRTPQVERLERQQALDREFMTLRKLKMPPVTGAPPSPPATPRSNRSQASISSSTASWQHRITPPTSRDGCVADEKLDILDMQVWALSLKHYIHLQNTPAHYPSIFQHEWALAPAQTAPYFILSSIQTGTHTHTHIFNTITVIYIYIYIYPLFFHSTIRADNCWPIHPVLFLFPFLSPLHAILYVIGLFFLPSCSSCPYYAFSVSLHTLSPHRSPFFLFSVCICSFIPLVFFPSESCCYGRRLSWCSSIFKKTTHWTQTLQK